MTMMMGDIPAGDCSVACRCSSSWHWTHSANTMTTTSLMITADSTAASNTAAAAVVMETGHVTSRHPLIIHMAHHCWFIQPASTSTQQHQQQWDNEAGSVTPFTQCTWLGRSVVNITVTTFNDFRVQPASDRHATSPVGYVAVYLLWHCYYVTSLSLDLLPWWAVTSFVLHSCFNKSSAINEDRSKKNRTFHLVLIGIG